MLVEYDKNKRTMTLTIPFKKNPSYTRFDAKSAEKSNCSEGDPKNWRLFTTGGFTEIDEEFQGRPIKIGLNIIAGISKKDRLALIEADED